MKLTVPMRSPGRVETRIGLGRAEEIRLLLDPRQAQVEDLDRAAGVEHQVRRLDIAMEDAPVVRGLQPAGRLREILDRPVDRQRALLP